MPRSKIRPTIFDHRPAIILETIAMIPIGLKAKDGYAIVDKEYSHLDKYKWLLHNGYAKTKVDKKFKAIHQFILPRRPKKEVDHINSDRLDNRRSNLRYATHQQNCFNQSKKKNNTTGYRGVAKHSTSKKFVAQITHNGKNVYLGLHETVELAAKAYNTKAKELYGEYAKLNNERILT